MRKTERRGNTLQKNRTERKQYHQAHTDPLPPQIQSNPYLPTEDRADIQTGIETNVYYWEGEAAQ